MLSVQFPHPSPCFSVFSVFVFCSVLISRILRIFLFEHGVSRSVTESLSICLRLIRVIRTVPSSVSVFFRVLRVRFLFCTDLTDTTDIFVRTRSFTKCHGIFVHLPPFNPCYPYSSLIRLRVFRVFPCSFFILH